MKCLNCGNETNLYLCNECNKNEVIENVIEKVFSYKKETCENNYLIELMDSMENDKYACILKLLENYTGKYKDYYYCRFLKGTKDPAYEETAINSLKDKDILETQNQLLLLNLLNFYIREDYVKPEKWCDQILSKDNLFMELYYIAAEFYSMVAEYDKSKYLIDKMNNLLNNYEAIFSNKNNNCENYKEKVDKLASLLERYKGGKPYWPSTEERRIKVAEVYDKKGITYGNIVSLKTKKVKEDEFEQINECYEYDINTYCSFWCNYIEGLRNIKELYQICAIKVVDNKIVDKFEKYIKPWDGRSYTEKASKVSGASIDVLENSESVDKVILEFDKFTGNDILISTGALGNQLNALIRAYRWSGLNKIENEFLELLDYASIVSEEFDMKNNTREYLLNYFKLEDSKDSYSKAYNNIIIFNKLKELEK